MSMRFHPKRRASTEKAPGPVSAKAMPIVASRMFAQKSSVRVDADQISRTITRNPAIGVQKPTNSDRPRAIASTSIASSLMGRSVRSLRNAWLTKPMPATTRKSKRPTPGHPRAKFENNLRKARPVSNQSVNDHEIWRKPQKSLGMTLLSIRGR
jgi:hypothetical protein